MNVPFEWFVFMESLPSATEGAESIEAAYLAFRDTLSPTMQDEIITFLERAIAEEDTDGEGYVIAMTSPEMEDTIIIMGKGQTNREWFRDALSLFRFGHT